MSEETLVTQEPENVENAPQADTAPRELDSVTKDYEDALYSKDDSSESVEAKPEGEKAEPSEDPGKDEVAEGKDAKAEEKSKDKEVTYDLELKEDDFMDQASLDQVLQFAKDNKLSKEAASNLWEGQKALITRLAEAETARQDAELEAWRSEIINDPNLGGENLKRTAEGARRVVQRFGDENLVSLLRDSGYGDNPAVVKFLYKISSIMSEDSLVLGEQGSSEKPLEDYFYKN